jgi:hypothetical protein
MTSVVPAAPPGIATGVTRLATALAVIALVWLGLLPRLGAWAPVAGHIRRMEEGGINTAAMVYTELERLPLRPDWIGDELALWRLPTLSREHR